MAFNTIWPFLVAVAAYAAAPVMLAARTCKQIGSVLPLVPLTGVYAIYGLARAAHQLGLARMDYHRSVATDEERRHS